MLKNFFSTLVLFLITFPNLELFSESQRKVHGTGKMESQSEKKVTIQKKPLSAGSRYDADGALFLDPYIFPYLKNLRGQRVLDAGCSKNPYGILAAQNGAYVHAIDIEPRIIECAEEAVQKAGVQHYVELEIGDVSAINHPDQFFNIVLSINVGSYLPVTTEIFTVNDQIKMTGLGPHCKEMARVLKNDGLAILAAPTSYSVLFTTGSDKNKIYKQIHEVLEKIGTNEDITLIKNHLVSLTEVHRATFVPRKKGLLLVTDERELQEGEMVWRKVPGHVLFHRYHPEKEYQQALLDAGFIIQRIDRPRFQSEHERCHYNEKAPVQERLGKEYCDYSPFIIFLLKKPASP